MRGGIGQLIRVRYVLGMTAQQDIYPANVRHLLFEGNIFTNGNWRWIFSQYEFCISVIAFLQIYRTIVRDNPAY